MAVITSTVFKGVKAPVTVARTVLSASDTLVYTPGAFLDLFNTTASPVVVTITGSAATTISPDGFGGTISVAAGKAVTVPASSTVHLSLDSIAAYLAGTVTVTGGVGVTAHLTV